MSAELPAYLDSIPEPLRSAIVAQADADHAADPGPPLSKATVEKLRVLLRRPAKSTERAA